MKVLNQYIRPQPHHRTKNRKFSLLLKRDLMIESPVHHSWHVYINTVVINICNYDGGTKITRRLLD